jgi:hypothetical protein
MFQIFLMPVVGLLLAGLITRFLPKAKFRGYDILPFFFIFGCQLIANYKKTNSFLPYGFLFYFILVVILASQTAIKNKNISVKKTLRLLWDYLTVCSIIWYLGMLLFLFA